MPDEISETGDYRGFYIIPYAQRFRAILKPPGKNRRLFSTPADAKKAIDDLLAGLPIQEPKPVKPKKPKKSKKKSNPIKKEDKGRHIILGD